jgi:hypothetical protein
MASLEGWMTQHHCSSNGADQATLLVAFFSFSIRMGTPRALSQRSQFEMYRVGSRRRPDVKDLQPRNGGFRDETIWCRGRDGFDAATKHWRFVTLANLVWETGTPIYQALASDVDK